MDHVKGGGNNHRREIKTGNIYLWSITHDFPEGFQTLCANCHAIKHDAIRQQREEDKRIKW
jgi:hypothetical protein